jgi:hypothetical protein
MCTQRISCYKNPRGEVQGEDREKKNGAMEELLWEQL